MNPRCPECGRLWQSLVDATNHHFTTENRHDLAYLCGVHDPTGNEFQAAKAAHVLARAQFHNHEKSHIGDGGLPT